IPNGIGTMFAVVQLILYATYYKSTKQQIAARNAKGEVNLSEVVVGNGNGVQDTTINNKIGAAPK
ncbi:Bidirectional sugar transporter SWEET4, partial [Sesbania bispinosa]